MMLPEMRRNDRQMADADAWIFLAGALVGRLGTVSEGDWPYVAPKLFVIGVEKGGPVELGVPGLVFFHTTKAQGHTARNIEQNEKVSFEVDEFGEVFPVGERDDCETSLTYRSVILFGRCRKIEAAEIKENVFELLMQKYADPAWGRSPGWSMAGQTAVYSIAVERITGKERKQPKGHKLPMIARGEGAASQEA